MDVSKPLSLKEITDYISNLLKDHEVMNINPTSLLPKEMKPNMDNLVTSQDPDVMEVKKFFMSVFDPDSLKLNTSLILLVTKATGLKVTPKEVVRDGVKVTTSNHQLLCESVQNYLLAHSFHAAMLNVGRKYNNEYTCSSLLCNKVCTLIGDHFFSMKNKRAAEMQFFPVFSLIHQANCKSIEGKFVVVKDVESWIERFSLEYAMDGHCLESAIILGDCDKKEEAKAAYEFGINFSLIRCIKKELSDFQHNKEKNSIQQNSLPVLHAFAGQEEKIETTNNVLQEVVKKQGVEKTIKQMKDHQEKALKSLHIFASNLDTRQVLENLVIAYVGGDIDSVENEKVSSMDDLINACIGLQTSTSNESLEAVKKFFLNVIAAEGSFKERMEKLMEYNMRGTSLMIAQVIAYFFAQLNPEATATDMFQAQVMGWLLSFVFLSLNITDDIVDNSKTKNGQPCWHMIPEVGRTAVLDSNIILGFIPLAVNHFFGHHPCYQEMALQVNKFIIKTTKGQLMDTENNRKAGSDNIDMDKFTWDIYRDKVLNTNSLSEISCFPFYLSGETNESLLKEMQKLAEYCSLFLQAINDFDDVYATDGSFSGTDIEEGKLTWLICKALEKASDEQKKILEENYGKKDKKCVREVKKVYRELNLKKEFEGLEFISKEETEGIFDSIIKASKGTTLFGEKGISRSFLCMMNKASTIYKKHHLVLFNL